MLAFFWARYFGEEGHPAMLSVCIAVAISEGLMELFIRNDAETTLQFRKRWNFMCGNSMSGATRYRLFIEEYSRDGSKSLIVWLYRCHIVIHSVVSVMHHWDLRHRMSECETYSQFGVYCSVVPHPGGRYVKEMDDMFEGYGYTNIVYELLYFVCIFLSVNNAYRTAVFERYLRSKFYPYRLNDYIYV